MSKRHAPATQRNREPIRDVLAEVLPERGTVLEVASGSGEHAVFLARAFPELSWQPSDVDPAALASVRAWRADGGPDNLLEPIAVDATEPASWPVERTDAIVSINMIHIAPWAACQGLVAGAASRLAAGAPLYLYGPFLVEGRETAPSNLAFDASLRGRNPAWGIRWLHEVAAEAERAGFELERTIDMPANNLSVVFRRR